MLNVYKYSEMRFLYVDMIPVKPIQKQSVSESVYKQLLSMIKSGELEAGTKLPSENKLSQMFNVSRISIRTALHKLEAVGLVETRNGEGTYVQKPDFHSLMEPVLETLKLSSHDIIEVLEFRKLVECYCTQQFNELHTQEDLEDLAHCLEKMRKYSIEGNVNKYSAWDARFHKRIVQCSGNHFIATVYDLASDSLNEHLCAMNSELGFELGMTYHNKIYQALTEGDAEKAIKYSERSINDSIEAVRAAKAAE